MIENSVKNKIGFMLFRALFVLIFAFGIVYVIIEVTPRSGRGSSSAHYKVGQANRGRPSDTNSSVSVPKLLRRLFRTTIFTFSIALIFMVAVPVAIFSATGKHPIISGLTELVFYFSSAIPVYWVGDIANAKITFEWKKYIVPVILIAFFNGILGEVIRHLRQEFKEVLDKEYMQSARTRGLIGWQYWWHAIRNMIAPSLGILTSNFAMLLSGVIVVERLFAMPGIGHEAWKAAGRRDNGTMLKITFILVLCVIGISLIGNILSHLIDPKFQDGGEN